MRRFGCVVEEDGSSARDTRASVSVDGLAEEDAVAILACMSRSCVHLTFCGKKCVAHFHKCRVRFSFADDSRSSCTQALTRDPIAPRHSLR